MSNHDAKMLVLLEIIAPSDYDDTLSQEERDSIKRAWKAKLPWNEVFGCVKDPILKDRYIQLLEKLDEPGDE